MIISKDFKIAISHLPAAEKDKLIYRLLKKDIRFAKRLEFELLSEKTVDQMRDILQERIDSYCKNSSENYHSAHGLLLDIRTISSWITEHVFTTKDKFGEIYLSLYMINHLLEPTQTFLRTSNTFELQKLYTNILSRLFKAMALTTKLHDDYYPELEPEYRAIQSHIDNTPYFRSLAIQNGLNSQWLSTESIPEDIADIQKDLRSKGHLR